MQIEPGGEPFEGFGPGGQFGKYAYLNRAQKRLRCPERGTDLHDAVNGQLRWCYDCLCTHLPLHSRPKRRSSATLSKIGEPCPAQIRAGGLTCLGLSNANLSTW